ncbi:MAG: NAD(P)H-binding protein, partial [Aliihoeflea sp.]
RRVVPDMLADRQRELAILQSSRLRWTMLRPPRLTDKPAAGQLRITFDLPASTAISRTDLARAVADALTDDTLIGRAPFVAG